MICRFFPSQFRSTIPVSSHCPDSQIGLVVIVNCQQVSLQACLSRSPWGKKTYLQDVLMMMLQLEERRASCGKAGERQHRPDLHKRERNHCQSDTFWTIHQDAFIAELWRLDWSAEIPNQNRSVCISPLHLPTFLPYEGGLGRLPALYSTHWRSAAQQLGVHEPHLCTALCSCSPPLDH